MITATVTPSVIGGTLSAVSSKSAAHRLLICSAFAQNKSKIFCECLNDDILATVSCLNTLGANICYKDEYFYVSPCQREIHSGTLDCKESGSTLRFLLPIALSVGGEWDFLMSGRLPYRPLSPLKEELIAHGILFENPSPTVLRVKGKLPSGNYTIDGGVSSQFISGLLFALSLLDGKSTLAVSGKIESAPYIDMTLDALENFGANIKKRDNTFDIFGNTLVSKGEYIVEGDWSSVAFALSAAAISSSELTVTNLNVSSLQADKEILSILSRFGAYVSCDESSVTVHGARLCGIELDASQIPDLVPVVAAVASVATGQTRIFGASRLRIKESDRLKTSCDMLSALGADIREYEDGLIINGQKKLIGGAVSSYADHRIAMSAAVAALACENPVTIRNAEATNKSYPNFWRDFSSLGVKITLE